jgi:hypothetical protein
MKPALGLTPIMSALVLAQVNDQGDGTSTLQHLDGTIVSCQPDGSLQSRPAGTAGAYERCVVDGPRVTYCPLGTTAFTFAFALKTPGT